MGLFYINNELIWGLKPIRNESVTCHQIDSTMREKIQASTFSNAEVNTFGSSQLPIPLFSKAVLSFFLGENPLHISGCVNFPTFTSPFFLLVLDPEVLDGVMSLVVLLIIVLSTIELDSQNVNLHQDARRGQLPLQSAQFLRKL